MPQSLDRTGDVGDIIVSVPGYLRALDVLLSTTKAQTLIDYLQWHVLKTFANHLSSPFDEAQFELAKARKRTPCDHWQRGLYTHSTASSTAMLRMLVARSCTVSRHRRRDGSGV